MMRAVGNFPKNMKVQSAGLGMQGGYVRLSAFCFEKTQVPSNILFLITLRNPLRAAENSSESAAALKQQRRSNSLFPFFFF